MWFFLAASMGMLYWVMSGNKQIYKLSSDQEEPSNPAMDGRDEALGGYQGASGYIWKQRDMIGEEKRVIGTKEEYDALTDKKVSLSPRDLEHFSELGDKIWRTKEGMHIGSMVDFEAAKEAGGLLPF